MRHERPRATIELYGGARPKPPTLPENQHICFSLVGESFSDRIRVAHKLLQEHSLPLQLWRYLKSEKKRRLNIFLAFFDVWKFTQCCKLQHFCVLTSCAGDMQKRRKWCKYFFYTSDAENTANTSVFERQANKKSKLQHFWSVDHTKCRYFQCFYNFTKTWKARNTVNSGVLATFGRRNSCIYEVF